MNELKNIEQINIENMIYEVRGVQVMLDRDLAILYQCKNGTKSINLAVKRNINRFPSDFMFQLTENECINLRFQIETANNMSRSFPYVFTEQGVAMLASVLHTEVAENISIRIMRAFVKMKKYISSSILEQKYINELVIKDSKRIDLLEETFTKFKEKNNEIYYEGQIYDAYSKIVDILKEGKEKIVIIDGYADKSVLDIIANIKVDVILVCKTKPLLKKMDIEKYNKEYNNLKIVYNDTYHDRYILIDKKILYHCGASLNYAGSKTFSINKINDRNLIESFINELNVTANVNI